MSPAPYHNMYGHNDVLPANKHPKELENMHPVFASYVKREDCRNFSDDAMRNNVVPAYMGLIKQIDDHIGRLVKFLEEQGRMDDTMIVFTADHGDYLGDHWLGEKELFHEESVRIPMIVYDPDPASDTTRGMVDNRLIEAIDLLPTFIETAGGEVPEHIIEGKSLLPILHGEEPAEWRTYAVSESEFAPRVATWELGIKPHEARATMIRTADWKYIHHEKFRPELFDLKNDPHEFSDLGDDPDYEDIRAEMRGFMFDSLRQRKTRTTFPDVEIEKRAKMALSEKPKRPVFIGVW